MTDASASSPGERRPPRTIGGLPVVVVVGLVAVIAIGMWWQWRAQSRGAEAEVSATPSRMFEIVHETQLVRMQVPAGNPMSYGFDADLAVLPDDTVVALWCRRDAQPQTTLQLARSTDRGQTFGVTETLTLPAGMTYNSAARLAVSPDGELFATAFANALQQPGGGSQMQLVVFQQAQEAQAGPMQPPVTYDWNFAPAYALNDCTTLATGQALWIAQGGWDIGGGAHPLSATPLMAIADGTAHAIVLPKPLSLGLTNPSLGAHERGVCLIAQTPVEAEGFGANEIMRLDIDPSYRVIDAPQRIGQVGGINPQLSTQSATADGRLGVAGITLDVSLGTALKQAVSGADEFTPFLQHLTLWELQPDGPLIETPNIMLTADLIGEVGPTRLAPWEAGWLIAQFGFDDSDAAMQSGGAPSLYQLRLTYLEGSTPDGAVSATSPCAVFISSPYDATPSRILTWDDRTGAMLVPSVDPGVPNQVQLTLVRFRESRDE